MQLLQSDRRGQAQSALRAVESRHQAIQKIEQQMIELAQLFQDMEAMVVNQDNNVVVIEEKGRETAENVDKANVEINGAIEKARSRNRKKWWCALIIGTWNTPWNSVYVALWLTLGTLSSHHHRHYYCCGPYPSNQKKSVNDKSG